MGCRCVTTSRPRCIAGMASTPHRSVLPAVIGGGGGNGGGGGGGGNGGGGMISCR